MSKKRDESPVAEELSTAENRPSGPEHSVAAAAALRPQDIADVQRLMQGVNEEVQKLGEGLRVLSAYLARLREHGADRGDSTLH